jgi:hypothetical protein
MIVCFNFFEKIALIPFSNSKYVLVVIDTYCKWCEAKPIKEHIVTTIAKFLQKEIICKFGVPKYVTIDNGGEWMTKFDMMCKNFGITHQFTTP